MALRQARPQAEGWMRARAKSMKTGRGTALRTHTIHTRFAPVGHGGGPPLDIDVAELRKMLRTDLTLTEIANHFSSGGLAKFIRRRNICDPTERRRFITLKRSLAKDTE